MAVPAGAWNTQPPLIRLARSSALSADSGGRRPASASKSAGVAAGAQSRRGRRAAQQPQRAPPLDSLLAQARQEEHPDPAAQHHQRADQVHDPHVDQVCQTGRGHPDDEQDITRDEEGAVDAPAHFAGRVALNHQPPPDGGRGVEKPRHRQDHDGDRHGDGHRIEDAHESHADVADGDPRTLSHAVEEPRHQQSAGHETQRSHPFLDAVLEFVRPQGP
jgi:hypothetical protein